MTNPEEVLAHYRSEWAEQGTVSDFDLIHATPVQRCKAALLAVGDE